jgi:ribonuclease E
VALDGDAARWEVGELEAEIDAALQPVAALPGGGDIAIETTRALTAIDVDSGSHAGDRGASRMALEVNLAAAAEAARQLRLRNISGLIVIDFIKTFGRRWRARIVDALRDGFVGDPAQLQLGRISELGLFEMSRQRLGPTLAETLGEPCRACAGDGRVKSAETLALEGLRLVLREVANKPSLRPVLAVPTAVATALKGPLKPAVDDTEARLHLPLALRVIADDAPHHVRVETAPPP